MSEVSSGLLNKNSDFWESLFCDAEIYQKNKPLTQKEFDDVLKLWNSKLSNEEKEILQKHMPLNEVEQLSDYFQNRILPTSYSEFLRYCNIVEMMNGERYFQFLSLHDTRAYSIAYMFPKWLNEGITFAMNGGGIHYVFDMRKEIQNGEYPIYAVSSGNLGWGEREAFFLGNSFLDVLTDNSDVERILYS